jgi:hypothetical protein
MKPFIALPLLVLAWSPVHDQIASPDITTPGRGISSVDQGPIAASGLPIAFKTGPGDGQTFVADTITGFGAVADVRATDDTAPLQNFLNFNRSNGRLGFIPVGAYGFVGAAPVTIDMSPSDVQGGMIIQGEGWGLSGSTGTSGAVLSYAGTGSAITATNTTPPNQNGLMIFRDFALRGDGADIPGGHLFDGAVVNETVFENLFVGYSRGDGLHMQQGFGSRVEGGIFFDNRGDGIYYGQAANNVAIRDVKAFGNGRDFTKNAQANIFLIGAGNTNFAPVLDNDDVSYAGKAAYVIGSTLTKIVVYNGLAVATATANGRSVGDWITVRFSGERNLDTFFPVQITAATANTFTFPVDRGLTGTAANGTYNKTGMFVGTASDGLYLAGSQGARVNGLYCENPSNFCAYVAKDTLSFGFDGGFVLNGWILIDSAQNGSIDNMHFQGAGGLYVREASERATVNIGLGNTYSSGAALFHPRFYMQGGVRYGPGIPKTGTWAVGERLYNSMPSIGVSKSWVCIRAGTPGTWVSEGNLE